MMKRFRQLDKAGERGRQRGRGTPMAHGVKRDPLGCSRSGFCVVLELEQHS